MRREREQMEEQRRLDEERRKREQEELEARKRKEMEQAEVEAQRERERQRLAERLARERVSPERWFCFSFVCLFLGRPNAASLPPPSVCAEY